MKHQFTALCSTLSLPLIREFMGRELAALAVDESVAGQIVLAVDEACANSIIHQHHCDGTSEILISVHRRDETLLIEIKDTGEPFRIDEYQPADLQQIIESGTRGGLGISLIHKIMDRVEVIKGDGTFFRYRFTKFLG